MTVRKMHDDEFDIDAPLVRRLLEAQFPCWAGLPLKRVASDGTDNAMFRLGDDMAVRLPRIAASARNIDKECAWLPRLAPHLPLPVPVPLAKGAPGEGYPWSWSVCPWLTGENPQPDGLANADNLATDLAGFVRAMHRIDTVNAPRGRRGVPLAACDAVMQESFAESRDLFDVAAASRIWDRALQIAPWAGPPVWFHGDLMPGNLLMQDGRLSAIIDFGTMGVGDPACDCIAGWIVFDPSARDVFCRALGVDDATWARGRAWALITAVRAYRYYIDRSDSIMVRTRRTLAAILADPDA